LILSASDKEGKSTQFIEYMLLLIQQSLYELLESDTKKLDGTERLEVFLEQSSDMFSRKEYMKFHKELSSATASRDLKKCSSALFTS
jgi:hypothetical protein